jgi:hypothetical protein
VRYSRATELLLENGSLCFLREGIEEGANIDEIFKTCKSILIYSVQDWVLLPINGYFKRRTGLFEKKIKRVMLLYKKLSYFVRR